MGGEKRFGRIGWIDITILDAGGRVWVIEDSSGAVAALYQPPTA